MCTLRVALKPQSIVSEAQLQFMTTMIGRLIALLLFASTAKALQCASVKPGGAALRRLINCVVRLSARSQQPERSAALSES